jgi:hypothetical protein
MASLSSPFQPAIDALEKDAADLERQWNALVTTINVLREKAGLPPRPTGGLPGTGPARESAAAGQKVSITHDTFYGKRMGTAAREYLEMRKSAGEGPAKPREIFDALTAGGFQFETKDEETALVSLRAALRKNTTTFEKLPNGTYGLSVWYPGAKKLRRASAGAQLDAQDERDDELPEGEVAGETSEDEEAAAA